MNVIVVGAGIAGLSTAWALTKAGHHVTILEQGAIPNPLAASGDHHRIIEAIIARDCVRAEQLMREHVYYAGLILRRNYEKLLSEGDAAPGAKPPARHAV